jgi:S-adenosylmethionine/arginine decarboxylase-like enzyme
LIDVKHIDSNQLKNIEMERPFMDNVIEEFILIVVGALSHQFEKTKALHGVTIIYLLSESHTSIHIFVGEGN